MRPFDPNLEDDVHAHDAFFLTKGVHSPQLPGVSKKYPL